MGLASLRGRSVMQSMIEPVIQLLQPAPDAMAIFGTGHRPEKVDGSAWTAYVDFTGYKSYNKWMKLEAQLVHMLKGAKATGKTIYVITGGQRGMDIVLARAAIITETKHILAIPFEGFTDKFWGWSDADRRMFTEIRDYTDINGIVASLHPKLKKGEKAAPIYNDRNHFMVDLATTIGNPIGIALWDGTKGGTGNCMNYAMAKDSYKVNERPMAPNRFIVFRPSDLSYTKNGKRYIECSTVGYGPSAFTSSIPTKGNGVMSIESIYQGAKLDGNKKPYAKPKGKAAKYIRLGDKTFAGELQTDLYYYLWYVWFTQTQEGKDTLARIPGWDVFTDMFDKGATNSQAAVMQLVHDGGIEALRDKVSDFIEAVNE